MSTRACGVKVSHQLSFTLAWRGRAEIVDILLRANARVDATDSRGWTACHAAAQAGHVDVLAFLLPCQPNLAVVDADGRTALCRAIHRYRREDVGGRIVLMLLEAGASFDSVDRDSLCLFASTGTSAIQTLIDHGVVVREILTSNGTTPLHAAMARTLGAEVFDMLVNDCGIDLEAHDRYGSTCIFYAADLDNDVALRCLIKAGADVNVAAIDNATPLHGVHNYDCAVLLLAGGANVCALDEHCRVCAKRPT